MAKKESDFVDQYVKRSLQLGRATEGQSTRLNVDIKKLHKRILDKIESRYPKLNSTTLGQLNREIKKEILGFHGELQEDVGNIVQTIVAKEAIWNITTLNKFIDTELSMINSPKVAARALKKTYQGHTFDFWFKSAGKSSAKQVTKLLSNGYIMGATPAETSRQIEGVLNRTGNDIKTLSRSYFQHAAMEARYETMVKNESVIEEYVWVSTLDGRTTINICAVRDGKRYDKNHDPIDHGLSWDAGPGRIHFNCRSNFIPRVKGMGDISKELRRPAINAGKNYESGDMKTRNGTVRKPTKRNREKGIFDVTRVHGTTDYETWLRGQKSSFVADIMNDKVAATDFKAGKISLLDFVNAGKSGDLKKL